MTTREELRQIEANLRHLHSLEPGEMSFMAGLRIGEAADLIAEALRHAVSREEIEGLKMQQPSLGDSSDLLQS